MTFVFDLDSTVTKAEILPFLAELKGIAPEMERLTLRAMQEEIPFGEDFPKRVDLISDIPLEAILEKLKSLPLHEELVDFIKENRERCRIVTGNLDLWVQGLMEDWSMKGSCYASKACIGPDGKLDVVSVLDKAEIAKTLPHPFVAIGDGSNDREMIRLADIGIGFGGAKEIAPSVIEEADYLFYTEEELVAFLRRLL